MRYVSYGIYYKIYFRNREGFTSAIVVYMAHMHVMEDRVFVLCELLRDLLLENIKISKEQGYPFWFGLLLVCLAMYYLGALLAKENVIWESRVLVARKIFRYLNGLDKREDACNFYFKYFMDM